MSYQELQLQSMVFNPEEPNNLPNQINPNQQDEEFEEEEEEDENNQRRRRQRESNDHDHDRNNQEDRRSKRDGDDLNEDGADGDKRRTELTACCKDCTRDGKLRRRACICQVPSSQRRARLGAEGCVTCHCTGCHPEDLKHKNSKTENEHDDDESHLKNGCCKACMKAFSENKKACLCQVPSDVRMAVLPPDGCRICKCRGCHPEEANIRRRGRSQRPPPRSEPFVFEGYNPRDYYRFTPGPGFSGGPLLPPSAIPPPYSSSRSFHSSSSSSHHPSSHHAGPLIIHPSLSLSSGSSSSHSSHRGSLINPLGGGSTSLSRGDRSLLPSPPPLTVPLSIVHGGHSHSSHSSHHGHGPSSSSSSGSSSSSHYPFAGHMMGLPASYAYANPYDPYEHYYRPIDPYFRRIEDLAYDHRIPPDYREPSKPSRRDDKNRTSSRSSRPSSSNNVGSGTNNASSASLTSSINGSSGGSSNNVSGSSGKRERSTEKGYQNDYSDPNRKRERLYN